MHNTVLQPASNLIATKHFEETIINQISISEIRQYVDSKTIKEIEDLYPTGKFSIWGVTNGKNGVNERKWKRIVPGDKVLFARKGHYFAIATIKKCLKNPLLAKNLWGVNAENDLWENIYLIDDLELVNVPYKKINILLNYKDNYIVRGFSVLNKDIANKLQNI